jgi:hypothetical protein
MGFPSATGPDDVRLLALMDERHGTPCGQAIKKLCKRADRLFGKNGYQILSQISMSHLNNLRASAGYKKHRQTFTKAQARKVNRRTA